MTVRVTLNCTLKSGEFTALKPFLVEHLPNVRKFYGCMGVSVFFDNTKGEMLLEEEWFSVKDHQTYLAHIQENGVLAELAAFFEAPPTIKYFEKEII